MSLLERLLGDLSATSGPEALAVVLALAYVVLAVRRSLWCWPCAFVSVAIYLVLFAKTGLFMQAALQVFYLGMAVYGWISWQRGRTDSGALRITTRPWAWHAGIAAFVLLTTLVNGWILSRSEAAAAPYVDAFVTWASVAATWMVARRILENWLYWIFVDLVAAWLYGSQGLALTAVLFFTYAVIAVRGHFAWQRERREQGTTTFALGPDGDVVEPRSG